MLSEFLNGCDVVWATNMIGCALWASMTTVHDRIECDSRFHLLNFGVGDVTIPFPERTTVYDMQKLDPEHAYQDELGKFILPVVLPSNVSTVLYMGTNTMVYAPITAGFFSNIPAIATGCSGDCFLANLTEWRSEALSEHFAKRIIQRGYYIAEVSFDTRAVRDPRLDEHIVRSEPGDNWASDDALRLVGALPWDLNVRNSACFDTRDTGHVKLSSATLGIIVATMTFAVLLLSLGTGIGGFVVFAFCTGRCKYSALPGEES